MADNKKLHLWPLLVSAKYRSSELDLKYNDFPCVQMKKGKEENSIVWKSADKEVMKGKLCQSNTLPHSLPFP